jgi:hypothetical protein
MADTADRSQSAPNLDWEGLIGFGENPNGFTAQTANGTAHDVGTGYNYQYDFGRLPAPKSPTRGNAEFTIGGTTIRGGLANRSGE